MFLKVQPERDLVINCKHLHVNMQIPVCVYNMETKHLMRLDLIHLSLLYGQHLRGYWIKSHKRASDLDVHNSSAPTENNNSLKLWRHRTKVQIYFSSLTNAVIAVI